ncbi:hypothetical protein L249_6448 [Ophiocordyceps polyrhachis-furcata BCC 54312]|uniref:Dihydrolipoamide acetyltransferase component of pyruvate dehydrogenase complex n=1 Tax=Ophiocordyceps polyrhachis-furcata BCC 54312 TaxID=1330021 RepID=A0A367LLR8_9HYPO|nr:hypothetical protein L249_6448 [Ophiocordyceps polyrhachis-furcata BCC 54312]
MASLAAACRASVRRVRHLVPIRGLATSSRCLAAHNFIMPALSPTMTEGNIASWKVTDGQSFSAGDVLLEIETDKATMDVEAQDDGVMMKILSADGSKSVQVGTRIAVVADAGDDVATLEMPADERPPPPQKEQQQPDGQSAQCQTSIDAGNEHADESTTTEHKHPLMPAVEHLLRQHRLGDNDIRRIKPTGPNGRLLKGDVLAFLGTIKPDAPASVSDRFAKLSRLDLSGIKVAASKGEAKKAVRDRAAKKPPVELTEPLGLTSVIHVQSDMRQLLGTSMALSTFVSRAADLAYEEIFPTIRSSSSATVDVFDQILGLDRAQDSRRRAYFPEIAQAPVPVSDEATIDIIDELAGPVRRPVAQPSPAARRRKAITDPVLKLVVPEEEEQRARAFLKRCKWLLEMEPKRLLVPFEGSP